MLLYEIERRTHFLPALLSFSTWLKTFAMSSETIMSHVWLSDENWLELNTAQELPVSPPPTPDNVESEIDDSIERTNKPESRTSQLSRCAAGRSKRPGYHSDPIWDSIHEVRFNIKIYWWL